MTVNQDILKSGPYNTDGTTKAFAATFQYLEDSDIVVTLLNTTTGASLVGVLNTDYTVVDNVSPIIGGTVTIANNGFGGIANATGVIAAGYTVTLNPAIPLLQQESYPNAGLFPSAAVEQALDRLTLICQGLQLATSESLKYPVTDSSTISNVLPNSTLRANLFLAFDSLGNPIAASSASGGVTISGAMIPVVQSTTTMLATKILLNATIASLAAGYVDTNVLEQMTGNVNSYAQEIIQNTSNGTTASADLVVSNNLSTATTFYGNFGMNSSGFTGSGSFNKASAVYLTSTSGDLAIGTTTANAIHFVYNSGTTDAAFIDGTGFNTITQAANNSSTLVATTAQSAQAAQYNGSGFINKFRNASCTIAQLGTSGTITAGTPGYTLDGWIIGCTGANVGWGQASAMATAQQEAPWAVFASTAVGVTDLFFKQRIESVDCAQLVSKQVTVQFGIFQNTAGSITPTLTVKHAGSTDNWTSPVTDVNAVSLQACAPNVVTQVAYTFACSASALNGLEITVDFGGSANVAGKTITVGVADIRATPGVATGLNATPPVAEIRPVAFEWTHNLRYYYAASGISWTAYPGSASAGNRDIYVACPVPMRTTPTCAGTFGAGAATVNTPTPNGVDFFINVGNTTTVTPLTSFSFDARL
jgi:hypothetical protein